MAGRYGSSSNRRSRKRASAPRQNHRSLAVEPLEARRLLSITPELHGIGVEFMGDDASDSLFLQASPEGLLEFSQTGLANSFTSDLNPDAAGDQIFKLTEGFTITVDLSSGDDLLSLDASLISEMADPGCTLAFDGGSGDDAIRGADLDTTWNLTGPDAGQAAGVEFTNVENITGASSQNDAFVFQPGATITGEIVGGGGVNTLDFTPVEENLQFTLHEDGTVSVDSDPNMLSLLGVIPEDSLSMLVDSNTLRNVNNIDVIVAGDGDDTFALEGGGGIRGCR